MKKRKMARLVEEDFTCEQLIEALSKSRGFILSAKKYLEHTYGIRTSFKRIKTKIKLWEMQDWLDDIRKSLVEDCLSKTFAKAVAQGDNTCLGWIIEKYGHHVDFLDGKDVETESKKGWKELLQIVKGTTESDTSTQS